MDSQVHIVPYSWNKTTASKMLSQNYLNWTGLTEVWAEDQVYLIDQTYLEDNFSLVGNAKFRLVIDDQSVISFLMRDIIKYK